MRPLPQSPIKPSKLVLPSSVLLISSLPGELSEVDIAKLVQPWCPGYRPKIFLLVAVGKAFVEFCDVQSARVALEGFETIPLVFRGLPVTVTYSRHQRVATVDDRCVNSKVLLVSITKIKYEVNIDLLFDVFSGYGNVEKILKFSRNPNLVQALIQYNDTMATRRAIKELNCTNIYKGCNLIQLQASRLQELHFNHQNADCWDYVLHPRGPSRILFPVDQSSPRLVIAGPVVICYNIPINGIGLRQIFNLFSIYGNIWRIRRLHEYADTVLIQYSDVLYAVLAIKMLGNCKIGSKTLIVKPSKKPSVKLVSISTSNLDCSQFSSSEKDTDFDIFKSWDRCSDFRIESDLATGLAIASQTITHAKSWGSTLMNYQQFVVDEQRYKTLESIELYTHSATNPQKISIRNSHNSLTTFAIVQMASRDDAIFAVMHNHSMPLKEREVKIFFSKTKLL